MSVLSFLPNDASVVLDLVQRLASIAVIISSSEYLVMRSILKDAGLMSWNLNQVANMSSRGSIRNVTFIMSPFFGYPGIVIFVCIRLAFALLLLLGIGHNGIIETILTIVIAASSIILVARAPYGHNGADQMVIILFVTLSVAHGFGSISNTTMIQTLALIFVAAQACLAYFAAGIYKAALPVWQSGKALVDTFSSETFGNGTFARFFQSNKTATKVLARGVALFECTFPLVLLPVPFVTEGYLIIGISFHLFNALVMRLNTFFWSFVATYPAIVFVANMLSSNIRW